jgi:fimbrial chaperone protein
MERILKSFLLVILFLINTAHAFKLTPMVNTIDLRPGKNTTLGTIYNENNLPAAIQLTVFKRSINLEGKESQIEEFDEVNVYPPQVIVPPMGKKTFKITYTGSNIVKVERSYRVLAEESAVDLNPIKIETSGIKFKVSYSSALYVTPKNARSNVVVKSISKVGKKIKLLVENTGNRHQNMNNLKVSFFKNEKDTSPIVMENKELKGMAGENILAETVREFNIDKVSVVNVVDSSYIAKLSFDKD